MTQDNIPRSSEDIRESFLAFFEKYQHRRMPSAPLIPKNDPTLLFTNAGMVPFKDFFLGQRQPPHDRVTSVQKCVRAGGKHNDLEWVGVTPRHHTFFEMLGNFSFGDYFKREAIAFAWEYLTDVVQLSPKRLWITVFETDDEAVDYWRETAGPDVRILRLGEAENFWSMGDTGPCGPCSEVIYDRGERHRCSAETCAIGACDCDRWLEIWNLVFMQYDRDEAGELHPLEQTGIDTGMGLERMASVLQNVASDYDTDLFRPLIAALEKLTGHQYAGTDVRADFAFRVIADHIRACAFLIADGVFPSNEGRGYVLRRILRRAYRFGVELGFEEPFLWQLIDTVVDQLGGIYPELRERQAFMRDILRKEEARFAETLDQGMALLEEVIQKTKANGNTTIGAAEAFILYDTFGFPIDLLEDVAFERGLSVDREGFEEKMAVQRQQARAARGGDGFELDADATARALGDLPETQFAGYDALEDEAEVLALLQKDGRSSRAGAGEDVHVVLDRTPFYAEAGGQVGDSGLLEGSDVTVHIRKAWSLGDGRILHTGEVKDGVLVPGVTVRAQVDAGRRLEIARHHTATHLLHAILREVLGSHVQQAGSLVVEDRLRFDFTHPDPVSPDQQREIERRVNDVILSAHPVHIRQMPREQAVAEGALALFESQYQEHVRVIDIPGVSAELCGGCHVQNTAELGLFKILSESSVGAGLRRLEAVVGWGVIDWLRRREDVLAQMAALMESTPEALPERLEDVLAEKRALSRRVQQLESELGQVQVDALLEDAIEVAGIRVLAAQVEVPDVERLREMADAFRARLKSAAVILAQSEGEKVTLVGAATPDAVSKGIDMGTLVRELGQTLGGGGGGRPDMAQAGGSQPEKLPVLLKKARCKMKARLEGSDQDGDA